MFKQMIILTGGKDAKLKFYTVVFSEQLYLD